MPCNSDYMNPTDKERKLQETAQLYCYALRQVGMEPGEPAMRAAKDSYCKVDFVPALCAFMRSRDSETQWRLRTMPTLDSARLNLWWLQHEKADKEREAAEADAARNKRLREQALAKLTPEERKALNL